MHRRIFQLAIVFLWLALPLVALQYRQVWDQLPVHVATHFNAAGQANGWMSRDQAIKFGVGFIAFLLAIFTPLLLYMTRSRVDAFSWAMLAFCALVLGIMAGVNRGIVNYNLHGTSMLPGTMLLALPIALVLLIAIYIASRREPALPLHRISGNRSSRRRNALRAKYDFAHSARLSRTGHYRRPGARSVPAPFDGPRRADRFRHHRRRLERIPVSLSPPRCRDSQPRFPFAFDTQAADPELRARILEPVRGYGIRGIGNTRAYVWGNKVVHIKTSNGDVFLGHSDPDRIVRDLGPSYE